jgi:Mg2+/citrate symporter
LEWRSSLFGYLCKSRGKINEKSQDNLKKKKKKKKKQVLEYNSVVVVVSSRPIFWQRFEVLIVFTSGTCLLLEVGNIPE